VHSCVIPHRILESGDLQVHPHRSAWRDKTLNDNPGSFCPLVLWGVPSVHSNFSINNIYTHDFKNLEKRTYWILTQFVVSTFFFT
jgi:hypothetical protein